MNKVIVDKEKCIGCGACVAIDPENFDFDDDGISTVIKEEASETAKDAEEACPVLAIDIVEDDNNTKQECHCKNDCHCTEDNCDYEAECNCECQHEENCNCAKKDMDNE